MPSNDSADQAIEDRRWKAWELRVKGKSYRAIGEALGVSGKTAHQDCQIVLARVIAEANENAAQDRATALYRLDKALEVVESAIDAQVFTEAGEADHELRLKALDRLMRIEERRAKLLGLDAPTKQEVSGPEGAPIPVDARSSLLDRLAGLVAGENAPGPAGSDPAKPDG